MQQVCLRVILVVYLPWFFPDVAPLNAHVRVPPDVLSCSKDWSFVILSQNTEHVFFSYASCTYQSLVTSTQSRKYIVVSMRLLLRFCEIKVTKRSFQMVASEYVYQCLILNFVARNRETVQFMKFLSSVVLSSQQHYGDAAVQDHEEIFCSKQSYCIPTNFLLSNSQEFMTEVEYKQDCDFQN